MIAKVLRGLRDEKVSSLSIAKALSVPVDELRKSTFGLMLGSIEGDASQPEITSAGVRPTLRVV